MKKKFLYIWITVLAMGLTSATSIATNVSMAKSAVDFEDLKDLDAATKAKFDAMISAGIFDGVAENTFGLKEDMNRAQFAKVAALVSGLRIDDSLTKSSFEDVRVDDPLHGFALPYIEAIKKAGITDGYGDGTFNPAGTVTKEQLATFMVRIVGKEEAIQSTPPVTDSTVSNWAKGYVQLAIDLKLLDNAADGTFGGRDVVSRELLTTGSFETARTIEQTKPLEVSGADFVAGNKLQLTLTVSINAGSVDLSKIMINGMPLDPKLDSYELSEDKKTIIIKLHAGFQLNPSKTPVITVNGLTSLFGNKVKNEEGKTIPVKLTVPPVYLPTPVTEQPAPAPVTEQPAPVTEQPAPTTEETTPNSGTSPTEEPN